MMAGSAPVEEGPKLGRGATIAGFLVAVLILSGFSAATALSHEDKVAEIKEELSHADDYGDDHADDDYADDDHGDE